MNKGSFLKSAALLSIIVMASALMLVQTVIALSLEGVRSWYWTADTKIFPVAVGDVDGGGETEIVTGGWYYDGARMLAQLAVWNGSNLALEDVTTWYWEGSTYVESVAVGDVDGDDQTEIVTGGFHWNGTRYNAQLAVWNGATLTLEDVNAWYWTAETRIESVAVGDVDGDSVFEIVTGGWYDDTTVWNTQLTVWIKT